MQKATHKPQGYRKLAKLMGPYPEIAIFRRFGSLTMFNLMRLQAELVAIDDQLQRIGEQDDLSADSNISSYSMDFYALNNSKHPNDAQLQLLEQSRIKLEQYYSLLLKAGDVANLNRPWKYHLKFLRDWLVGENEGDSFLSGRELELTWDENVTRDLVGIAPSNSFASPISGWLNPRLVDWYHEIWGGRRKHRDTVDSESGEVYDYKDSKFVKSIKISTSIAATIVASLLPALVILWLHYVERTVIRIGIIIGFTAAIGIFLRICTNANMKEIFGATAAFAAVEVVFIGAANGTGA